MTTSSSAKFLFEEGLKTFGAGKGGKNLDVFFNLFLVVSKARRATLIESANDRDFYVKFVKWMEENKLFTDDLNAIEIESGAPQYLVFNTTLLKSTTDVLKMIKSSEGMGKLLGFKCPGELGGKYTLIFKVNGVEFYTERCEETPDKKFVEETLLRFEKAVDDGGLKGYKVTYEILSQLLAEDWLEIISSPSSKPINKDLYDQRFDLSNLFANIGMNITAEKIDELEDEGGFDKFCKKYRQFLIFALCYYMNDPLEMFYPLTDKQDKEFNKKIENIETLFFKSTTA